MYFYYNTATFDREYYVSRKLFVINNNYVLEITVGRYAEILTWSPIRKPQLITSDLIRCILVLYFTGNASRGIGRHNCMYNIIHHYHIGIFLETFFYSVF